MRNILQEIIDERAKQNAKWGDQKHWLGDWMTILGKEYGEVCEAVCATTMQGDIERIVDVRKELIQVAAVAVQIIEKIDRAGLPVGVTENTKEEKK